MPIRVSHLFGKRYMWLLNDKGVLELHKVDDRGDEESKERLAALEQKEEEGEPSDLP